LTQRSLSLPISRRSASSILFLLSGEETGIPAAEAMALARMQDSSSTFEVPNERVVIATTKADPSEIEARIAYSRRVGALIPGYELDEGQLRLLRSGTYAIRVFDLRGKGQSEDLVSRLAEKVSGRVSLKNPDAELTVVRGEEDYLAVTRPSRMSQRWVKRRPRARAFFHPSAIFPKFSRLLVNLSGARAGESFLDPFCGTGSLLLEAAEVGIRPIGIDLHRKMTAGALLNRSKFGQDWLGVIRADARRLPLVRVDAIATDIPYGKLSTTSGSSSVQILENLIKEASTVLVSGRRLVVMHPDSLHVEGRYGFEIENQLHVFVHKKLTRTVTVLRRS
jgi:tRNA (guanine10-N2)-dimethyltransferase